MSFRTRLIISLILLLIPLVISDVYFHYREYRNNLSAESGHQTEAAIDLANAMEFFMERTVSLQRAVGQAIVRPHWHTEVMKQEFVQAILASSPYLRQVAFAGPSGVITEGVPASVKGVRVSNTTYFRRILNGADWSVSNLVPTGIAGEPGFIIATSVRDPNGRLLGMVVSGIDERALVQVLHFHVRPHTLLVLVDRNGVVVFSNEAYRVPSDRRDWSRYPFVQGALRGNSQHITQFMLPGSPHLTGSMVPVGRLGWAAGAFTPREEVVAPVRIGAIQDLSITIAVLILTVLIGSVVARQTIRPVERLSRVAQQLGGGNLGARASVPSTKEFATLAVTINQMAASIQERDQALHEAYERERRIATILQQRMLPQVPPKVGRLELAVGYFPALEEAELGGDFYDVMRLETGLIGLVVADVSGKGLNAAVHTAMAKYMLEGFAHEDLAPAVSLARASSAMRHFSEEWSFVTAFFGIIDPSSGQLTYANAGHPQPIVRHRDGSTRWLSMASGPPLVSVGGVRYHDDVLMLSEGDTLILYTDGVIEARKGDEWFGMEGVQEIVRRTDASPREMVDAIYRAVSEFVGGDLPDDIALLVARFK